MAPRKPAERNKYPTYDLDRDYPVFLTELFSGRPGKSLQYPPTGTSLSEERQMLDQPWIDWVRAPRDGEYNRFMRKG